MRIIIIALALAALTACSSSRPVVYPSGPAIPVGGSRPVIEHTPRAVPAQGPFQPNATLSVCKGITVSNRPSTDGQSRVYNFNPLIVVNNIVLAAVPVNDVCLTSGFGPRRGKVHKGLDLQSRPAGPIYSAGPGTIIEASAIRGFGNQVLIDHGNGVYTRYGHMAYFAPGLAVGQRVGFGVPLGQMGQTGNATAEHLHFEILTGNYNTPRKSWGLTPNNPLSFPAWAGAGGVS